MSNCIDCNQLPKALPKHRCYWCQLRKEGTDSEVAAAYERKLGDLEQIVRPSETFWSFCEDCQEQVPTFYMKTKKRCRGCQLVKDRDYRDGKKYNLPPGERQRWYDAQNGKCFGCHNKQNFTGLAVHHSHLDGEPYFLSCQRCNQQVMGGTFDNPMVLIRLGLGMLFPPHKNNGNQAINAILAQIEGYKAI
jgi:hypothetical protein